LAATRERQVVYETVKGKHHRPADGDDGTGNVYANGGSTCEPAAYETLATITRRDEPVYAALKKSRFNAVWSKNKRR